MYMCSDLRLRARVGNGYSEFGVVGVHRGSVLSSLLFIIVLGVLSMEFYKGYPCELLYVDDLMIKVHGGIVVRICMFTLGYGV